MIVPTPPYPGPMDFIVTVKKATTNFKINMDLEDGKSNLEDENSATTAGTSSKIVTAPQPSFTPGGRVMD